MGLDVSKSKDLLAEINRQQEIAKRHIREISGIRIGYDYNKIDEDIVYRDFLCIQYEEPFFMKTTGNTPRQYEVKGYCVKYTYDPSTGMKVLHLWNDELFSIVLDRDQPCRVFEIKHPSEIANETNSSTIGSCSSLFI